MGTVVQPRIHTPGHGWANRDRFHPPERSLILSNCLVSVSMCVNPWLTFLSFDFNCGVQVESLKFTTMPENNKSLPNLSVGQGQMGDGSSPSSLSRTDIRRALFRGCQLPDAILHGKRSLRPRSRAVQRLSTSEFRVRLFSSLRLVVAPPACEPG